MKTIPVVGSLSVCVAALMVASASAQPKGTTINVVQHDSHFQFIDVAPKGGMRKPPSEGDEFVIGGRLTAGTRTVGSSNLVCTVTQPGANGLSECVGSLILVAGTIEIGGASPLASDGDTFAVTGGTGTYASATGILVSHSGKNDTTIISVRLN